MVEIFSCGNASMKLWSHSHIPYRFWERGGGDRNFRRGANPKKTSRKDKKAPHKDKKAPHKDKKAPHMVRKVPQRKKAPNKVKKIPGGAPTIAPPPCRRPCVCPNEWSLSNQCSNMEV